MFNFYFFFTTIFSDFRQNFSYMYNVAVSFIGGGNHGMYTQGKKPIKLLNTLCTCINLEIKKSSKQVHQ